MLEDHSESAALGSERGHLLAVDDDPSLIESLEAAEKPERGRLPAPARAQQRQDRPPLDAEGDPVDGAEIAEGFAEGVEA